MNGPNGIKTVAVLASVAVLCASDVAAQAAQGTVLDATSGDPVPLAGIYLLDRERNHVAVAMADSTGRYYLEAPQPGEYVIVAERFGYRDFESPLLAMASVRSYVLDLELRPEPVGLEGLTVTVTNEQVIDWLTLEFGQNPNAFFGFRMFQGDRLAEAKLRARNRPTETLRWLYVPISHAGACVRINSFPRAVRGGWGGPRGSIAGTPGQAPAGTTTAGANRDAYEASRASCGTLYLDGLAIPNEHIDALDMTSIAAIVTLPGSVRMFTYGFDWGFR